MVADGRDYTNVMVNTGYQLVHVNVLDHICMTFLVNFLLPEPRNKVMEKKPTTMAESVEIAAEAQRLLKDKNKPLGSITIPKVLASHEGDDVMDDMLFNVVEKYLKQKNAIDPTSRTQPEPDQQWAMIQQPEI